MADEADRPHGDRDDLHRARDAFERGAWREAYDALSRADEATPLDAADLWLLGIAAYLLGRGDDFLAALERAHHLHVEVSSSRALTSTSWPGTLTPATGSRRARPKSRALPRELFICDWADRCISLYLRDLSIWSMSLRRSMLLLNEH